MKAKHRLPADEPIAVVCEVCDGRMELKNHEDALIAGWTEIKSAPACLTASFVGLCSGCRREEQEC
jgi:hypothetical protein